MDPIEDYIIRIFINEYIEIINLNLSFAELLKPFCSFILDIVNLYKFKKITNLQTYETTISFKTLLDKKNSFYKTPIKSALYKKRYILSYKSKTQILINVDNFEIYIPVIDTNISLQTNLLHYIAGCTTGFYWGYPVYDNNLECFASPFNHTSPNYCSLFSSDLKPNFADLTYQQIKDYKACVVNPPFTELMFNLTVEKIKSFETFKGIFIFANWEDIIKIFESTFKIIKKKVINYTFNLLTNKHKFNVNVYVAAFTYNSNFNYEEIRYLENYINKF